VGQLLLSVTSNPR